VGAEKQSEVSKPISDEVIWRAQQGDAAAFEQIYRTHSRRVYVLCLRMVSNPTQAEDLMQDVFVQVFRKIDTFRGESAFSTWLHRIAVNIVLMNFRKKSLVDASVDALAHPEEETSEPPKEFGAPDERLAGAIDRIVLQAAINQLPPGYKAIFILHDVHGYGHHEIAGMVGCSIGNSKSQLHKARVRLRKLLQNPNAKRSRRRLKSTNFSAAIGTLENAF